MIDPSLVLALLFMVIGWCFGFGMGIYVHTRYAAFIDRTLEIIIG